jgi:hypothetical protein
MASIKEHWRIHGDIRGSRTWQVHNNSRINFALSD